MRSKANLHPGPLTEIAIYLDRLWQDVRDHDQFPVKVTSTRRAGLWVWVVIAVLYAAGWGFGVINAIAVLGDLLRGKHLPDTLGAAAHAKNVENLGWVAIDGVVTIAAALIVLHYLRLTPRPPGALPITWRRVARTVPYSIVATTLGFLAVALLDAAFKLPSNRYPGRTAPDPLTFITDVSRSFIAGPSEEIVLLALPAVLLRTVGFGWRTVFIVAIVLRVPFHLYYGPGAIGLALWAALMVLLIRRFGESAILGAIIEHSLFDMSTDFGLVTTTIVQLGLPFLGVLMLGAWGDRVEARNKFILGVRRRPLHPGKRK